MSQRNPMNQRYKREDLGSTKKSAASLKPKLDVAATTHVQAKPTTKSEKRAAAKARQAERERKQKERERKQSEREAAEHPEAKPKKKGFLAALGMQKNNPSVADDPHANKMTKALNSTPQYDNSYRSDPQYKKLRRIYWVLMAIGVVSVVASLLIQMNIKDNVVAWMVPMGVAYVTVIGALIIDFSKIRPIMKKAARSNGSLSPKQLKHEQEKQAQAAAIQAEKKAHHRRRSKQATKDRMRALGKAAETKDKADQ
ncbi:MAG: hypothetical protein LBL67_04065 [Coriobacteriales bacterium]|jgi:hypothetical protein|nr:hypothetical protein [Coriobacteriales bacterium]